MKKITFPLLTYNNKVGAATVSSPFTRKVTVFTGATGQTLAIPSTKSKKKEFIIMNNSSNSLTIGCVAANGTITAGTTSSAATSTLASGHVARFVSLGSIWYRIGLSPLT